ncbi:MAG: hypothetical protein IPH76_18760 [Xanthomonadales bacterium]|nr:hypothetical protein [Xanthomonadales bacterium]
MLPIACSVAAGVPMRAANSACDAPRRARAARTWHLFAAGQRALALGRFAQRLPKLRQWFAGVGFDGLGDFLDVRLQRPDVAGRDFSQSLLAYIITSSTVPSSA